MTYFNKVANDNLNSTANRGRGHCLSMFVKRRSHYIALSIFAFLGVSTYTSICCNDNDRTHQRIGPAGRERVPGILWDHVSGNTSGSTLGTLDASNRTVHRCRLNTPTTPSVLVHVYHPDLRCRGRPVTHQPKQWVKMLQIPGETLKGVISFS